MGEQKCRIEEAIRSYGDWDRIEAMIAGFPWSRSEKGEREWRRMPHGEALGLFERLIKTNAEEGKRLLRSIAQSIYQSVTPDAKAAVVEYLYLVFAQEFMQQRIIHGGLRGCEGLLALRVARLLSEAVQSGRFPPLDEDRGSITALCFAGKYLPLSIYHANMAGIPRSLLIRVRGLDFFRVLFYVMFNLRGFSPVLELHMPKIMGGRLTVETVVQDYSLGAQVIAMNPHLRGIYQANWYFDPALRKISPYLGEVGTFAGKNGALLVCIGSDAAAEADATLKSKTRRQLFEQGRYQPKRFARLWARSYILKWARVKALSQKAQEERGA
jgi:hypothetical protein